MGASRENAYHQATAILAEETPRSTVARAATVLHPWLTPLAGIDRADRKPCIDVKQWLLTISLTARAMAIVYAIFAATSG